MILQFYNPDQCFKIWDISAILGPILLNEDLFERVIDGLLDGTVFDRIIGMLKLE